jgi:hypothetical protein
MTSLVERCCPPSINNTPIQSEHKPLKSPYWNQIIEAIALGGEIDYEYYADLEQNERNNLAMLVRDSTFFQPLRGLQSQLLTSLGYPLTEEVETAGQS